MFDNRPESLRAHPLGEVVVGAAEAALSAVDPVRAVSTQVRVEDGILCIGEQRLPLSEINRIRVVGAGKAGARMAHALYRVLGERIEGGVVAVHVRVESPHRTGNIKIVEADHPVPDLSSVHAAQSVLRAVNGLASEDLVIVLISGGASSLLTLPADGLCLEDIRTTTDCLLRSGADIGEVNAVRRHLSAIKGGRLAEAAAPARVISLILSDVVGDAPDAVGSGPTAPDPSTFSDALRVVERFDLSRQLPVSVTDRLRRGAVGSVPETPKPGSSIFSRVENRIIGGNRSAVAAAAAFLASKGILAAADAKPLTGEARQAATSVVKKIQQVVRESPPTETVGLVFGGETVVTVRGSGLGGRNQELALAAVQAAAEIPGVILMTLATDGRDGPSDAAGAVVTDATLSRARMLGMTPAEFLDRNDSYHFFACLDDLIIIGPTHTNAADLLLVVIPPQTEF